MNIQADAQALRYSSLELHELSLDLARLIPEMEEVTRQLNKQTPLQASNRSLEQAVQEIGTQRYRLGVLSQALDNIAGMYGGVEERVGDLFTEVCQPQSNADPLQFPDFAGTSSRLSTLLYGG